MTDLNAIPYIEAANFGGPRSETSLIVIHAAETPETATAAESVAGYFASGSTVGSTHYTTDEDSTVQSVPLGNVCYGAGEGPTNGISVQIEQGGYTAQSRDEWLDPYSRATIVNTAALVKALRVVYPNIRPIRLTPAQLQAGERNGIVGHVDVHQAWPMGDGRTDPGEGFPWDVFLSMVTGDPSGTDLAAFYALLTELQEARDMQQYHAIKLGKGGPGGTFVDDPSDDRVFVAFGLDKSHVTGGVLVTMVNQGQIAPPPAGRPTTPVLGVNVELYLSDYLNTFRTVVA